MKLQIVPAQGLDCGCENRDGHADPHTDPDLGLEHGERSALNDDPEPLNTADGDPFCLCGHPNYLTCAAWPHGGILGAILYDADSVGSGSNQPGEPK